MKFIKALKKILKPVRWYDFRNTSPISSVFGLDRGLPIDRYYIEKFLSVNRRFIKGRVLEIGDNYYSRKFGNNVTFFDVLHTEKKNNNVTIVGDLTNKSTLKENFVDCFLCTQTLNFIFDFKSAIEGIKYVLKPGGTALVTLAGICQISQYDMDRWGDYWRFTTASAEKIFSNIFGGENVIIDFYGNVLSCIALLEGLSVEELEKDELNYKDKNYQLLITIIAKKV